MNGPWALRPNRVARFYSGGELLERFRREPDATDGKAPEDWVGSATRAWRPPGAPAADEGLSRVEVAGREVAIRELLDADPAGIAGSELVRRAGPTTGLLVKLLDAAVRLPVHAHPTRAFARTHLDSWFGKTEAWLIVGTRQMPDAEPPIVRIGFTRDVGRDELRAIIEDEQTESLVSAMHLRPAAVGDVWFIPAGVPHAIGAGVFMVEIEEPSDFSIVAETRGIPIDRSNANLRLGWDVAIDAFDRRAWSDADIDRLRHAPSALRERIGCEHTRLTTREADPFFRAERVVVDGTARPWSEEAFLVGVVTDGTGRARTRDATLEVRAGDTFAVPARGLRELVLEGDDLSLIACLPPRPEDLVER